MTRRHRTVAAFLAACALVFAQFAVSAHACILHERPAKVEVMAHHEGCGGAMEADDAPVNGNVCDGHCQYGSATFDGADPVPAPCDLAGPVLRVGPLAMATSAEARAAWLFAPAAAPPPPAILFGVLRI